MPGNREKTAVVDARSVCYDDSRAGCGGAKLIFGETGIGGGGGVCAN